MKRSFTRGWIWGAEVIVRVSFLRWCVHRDGFDEVTIYPFFSPSARKSSGIRQQPPAFPGTCAPPFSDSCTFHHHLTTMAPSRTSVCWLIPLTKHRMEPGKRRVRTAACPPAHPARPAVRCSQPPDVLPFLPDPRQCKVQSRTRETARTGTPTERTRPDTKENFKKVGTQTLAPSNDR